jgi:hypothetical protein
MLTEQMLILRVRIYFYDKNTGEEDNEKHFMGRLDVL